MKRIVPVSEADCFAQPRPALSFGQLGGGGACSVHSWIRTAWGGQGGSGVGGWGQQTPQQTCVISSTFDVLYYLKNAFNRAANCVYISIFAPRCHRGSALHSAGGRQSPLKTLCAKPTSKVPNSGYATGSGQWRIQKSERERGYFPGVYFQKCSNFSIFFTLTISAIFSPPGVGDGGRGDPCPLK